VTAAVLETLSRRLREEWDVPSPEEDRPQDIRYLCVSGSVEGGTAALLEDGTLPWGPVRLLLVTDAVFLILSFVCFEYVLDE